MSTLREHYEDFAREIKAVSYADWLVWQEELLTKALNEARTEKLIRVRDHNWEQATVWRDVELELQEALEEIKKELPPKPQAPRSIPQLIKDYPNDQELGEQIRKLYK